MFLASFVASASQLCRRSANFVLMLQEFAKYSFEERKETTSHLYFVLQQTHPSRRPDFAKYPTLFSKAVLLICDPHVWPNLAKKTVHALLSPKEIWRFMCFGPLVAPIPYLLLLCALFGIFNDPKVKSVKPRTWIITACAWISLMATLALTENTKGGKHATEALFAVLTPLTEYLPSLQPLDHLVERASQAVGLPFRFLPSSLFLAKLGYHILLICRDVFHGWQDSQAQAAKNEQQRRPTRHPTREAAYRADSEGESEGGLPEEEDRDRQNHFNKMRRHFAVIEEQLAVKAMHEANIQRILDEWREADGQQQIDAADTQSEITSVTSDLEGMEEADDDDNNIDAEGDGDQEYNSPEHHQPPVDRIQSPTSPATDQVIAHQPLQELGNGSPIEVDDGERTHSSFEHQQASVEFSISPTGPAEGQTLEELLGGEHGYDSDYEEEFEEDEDDDQGADVDAQSSPQVTHQTAESSHSEYSNEGEEEQSSPQTSDAAEPSPDRDDREHEDQSSSPSAPSIDLADLDDAQYFIDESDYHAVADEVPRFLKPVLWKPEGQNKGKERAQAGRGTELTRMAGEQFGDEHVTVAELEDFRQQGRNEEDENKLPSDHLKKLAEAQSFTNKVDNQHSLRTFENFMQEGEAAEQARQQARSDGNAELKSFQQGQAFVDGEDEQFNARSLQKFIKDKKAKQQQETSQPDLKALSNAQSFVEEDEVDQAAQEADNFIEEGKAEQQAQQSSQPDLKALSNAQSFVENDEVDQTAQEVNDFIQAGKAEQQQNEKTQADRKEELQTFQKSQSFTDGKDEQHNQRSLDKFMREGEAEEQARQASQPDLKTWSSAQAFVDDEDEQLNARSVDAFVEEGKAEGQRDEKREEKQEQQQQPDLQTLKEAQYFGDEHESDVDDDDDDDDDKHDKAAKDSIDASSSTHDGEDDDDDGRQTIREEHEDGEGDADAKNSDTEPEYTLNNTRDYYDERLHREQAEQQEEEE